MIALIILGIGVVLLVEVQIPEDYMVLLLVLLCVAMFPGHREH